MPQWRKRQALDQYIQNVILNVYPTLPYDKRAAQWHAMRRAELEKGGIALPFVDGQIAAIAFVNGLTLVTHNPKDFRHLEGLTVEDWVDD